MQSYILQSNFVQTNFFSYIEWSSHQPGPNVFDFSGGLNITEYFLTAQKVGLNVIVRLGPFIASERDNVSGVRKLFCLNFSFKLLILVGSSVLASSQRDQNALSDIRQTVYEVHR